MAQGLVAAASWHWLPAYPAASSGPDSLLTLANALDPPQVCSHCRAHESAMIAANVRLPCCNHRPELRVDDVDHSMAAAQTDGHVHELGELNHTGNSEMAAHTDSRRCKAK
jgi:hypothetical protein